MDIALEKKNYPKYAFYYSLALAIFSLLAVLFSEFYEPNIIVYSELIIFPLLGYMTKKANKLAALFLLIFFVVDRGFGFLTFGNYLLQSPGWLIFYVIISLVFLETFYRAYDYLRHQPKGGERN